MRQKCVAFQENAEWTEFERGEGEIIGGLFSDWLVFAGLNRGLESKPIGLDPFLPCMDVFAVTDCTARKAATTAVEVVLADLPAQTNVDIEYIWIENSHGNDSFWFSQFCFLF